jgi:tetratricopeptide (TPR) repeat protein
MRPALLSDSTLHTRLVRAREAEHLGDYDRAARLLEDYWQGVGRRPRIEGVGEAEGAELLLRAGALTGYLGSAAQTHGAQETALDLLTESHTIFSRLRLHSRVAEARIELATCYRRKGAFDAARAMLDSAAELLSEGDTYLLGLAAVRRAITETCAGELEEAVRLLAAAEGLIQNCQSPGLRGRHFNEYGAALFFLSEKGGDERWAEALEKFAAARRCFELAGHLRYSTIAENNMGYALVKLGRLAEAGRHIARARRLALCVDDRGQLALIDDTHSQLLMAQQRLAEAEAVSRSRLEEIAATDHGALFAENLTTHAVILARLGRSADAAEEFARAVAVADAAGDLHGARRAESLRAAELGSNKVLQFREVLRRGLLTFEWRVADVSLRDIGIPKGAAVRFVVSDRAKDGELVAVLTPAGRFVMRLYLEGANRIRLEGAHPRCPSRVYRREEINILGIADAQERTSP